MTPIEILALIVVVLSFIKLFVLSIKPESWMNFAKKVYKNTVLTSLVALIAGGVILSFLLKELSIVQIFASMLLFMMLFILGFAPHSNQINTLIESVRKDKHYLRKAWLLIIIWLGLCIWVLYTIFSSSF